MMDFAYSIASHVYSQCGDMELYTGILIAAMVVVWGVGSRLNKNIAETASFNFQSPLNAQFAVPGTLGCESSSHFFVYSTGRSKCSGLMVSLHLSPRNDFLSRYVISWFAPSWYPEDKVVIEILDPEIDPCVTLFICKKFQAGSFTDSIPELKKFCKQFNGSLDGGPFSAFSSSSLTGFTCICNPGGRAVGQTVFGKGSPSVACKFLGSLTSLFVSSESKSIKIELNKIPETAQDWTDAIEYSLSTLLESLASLKVSDAVRSEVEAQRNSQQLKAEREAELARRKEDLQKQKEDQLKNMSSAEREKMDEKRRKKEQKKNLRSGRIIL